MLLWPPWRHVNNNHIFSSTGLLVHILIWSYNQHILCASTAKCVFVNYILCQFKIDNKHICIDKFGCTCIYRLLPLFLWSTVFVSSKQPKMYTIDIGNYKCNSSNVTVCDISVMLTGSKHINCVSGEIYLTFGGVLIANTCLHIWLAAPVFTV